MTHPLHGHAESENAFLKRMEGHASQGREATLQSDDLLLLIAIARHWRKLETEAARHVESVICMLSRRFSGEPPYTGWEGLGLALKEDYAELSALRDAATDTIEMIKTWASDQGFPVENSSCYRRLLLGLGKEH